MFDWKRFVAVVIVCGGIGIVAASLPAAEPGKEPKAPAGAPQMQLPPGWTEADMQACMVAATPGKMHEMLAKSVGTWHGKNTLWPYPGAEPLTSESQAVMTPMLDGRFIKVEMTGDMPGMGPYNGFAIYGFDNVSKKFVATWIDNCGTGMANGTGDLSADGKTLTWNYTFNCPIQQKPVPLREIETFTSDTARTLEIFATDPKSGKEYKMMVIEFTKK